jgi:putative SOS response-associated peptidase YedK
MCGRYVLAGDAADYAAYLSVDRVVTESVAQSYNVAPTDDVYVVAEWQGERLLGTMRWGFVPSWAKEPGKPQINARAETIATKPMFRDAFARRRCILPADGFYEWEPGDRGRAPHWIRRDDGAPMAFAGIWSSWREPSTGSTVRTCAIVTTAAPEPFTHIHHRVPVSLDPAVWDAWLDRDVSDPAEVERLIRPVSADRLTEHEVSRTVNDVRNDGPHLLDPVAGRS